jgi:two-component system, OmpR family, alkaline phosphatase synthesis response regulator PhoP
VSEGRVLLVEDEPALARGLSDMLRTQGFDVHIAGDGRRGLDMATSLRPDLILLDIMLPKKDGFEVCQQIRANPEWRGVKVVMLTAKGRDTEVTKGLALGADAYVTKPFSTKDLVAQVRKLLGLGG